MVKRYALTERRLHDERLTVIKLLTVAEKEDESSPIIKV